MVIAMSVMAAVVPEGLWLKLIVVLVLLGVTTREMWNQSSASRHRIYDQARSVRIARRHIGTCFVGFIILNGLLICGAAYTVRSLPFAEFVGTMGLIFVIGTVIATLIGIVTGGVARFATLTRSLTPDERTRLRPLITRSSISVKVEKDHEQAEPIGKAYGGLPFCRYISLPETCFTEMSDAALVGLLGHERAHLRRWHQLLHLLVALGLPGLGIWGGYEVIVGADYSSLTTVWLLVGLVVVGILLSTLLFCAFSRHAEYDADRMAARYLNDPAPVIAMVEHPVGDENDAASDPSSDGQSQDEQPWPGVDRLRGLFAAYPSNEDRIAKLETLSVE
jgi:hypothetical protein